MAMGISLHIGVDRVDHAVYGPDVTDLEVCEDDARAMAELAKSVGISTSTVLLGSAATREAVSNAIGAAAKTLHAGDSFLCTYAGHGAQLKVDKTARSGAEETDGYDEAWCLYDGALLDDELQDLWADFRAGVRVMVLSDSCHSGTVLRATSGVRMRALPRRTVDHLTKKKGPFYAAIQAALPDPPRDVSASVRLFAACRDHESAQEDDEHGAFTGAVLKTWNDGAFQGTHAEFLGAVGAALDALGLPMIQTPNHYFIGTKSDEWDAQRPFELGS